jgi:hypothetical protein
MKNSNAFTTSIVTAALALTIIELPKSSAQNPQMQQSLEEIKQAAAMNKQALSRYSWEQQVTISIKGNVKKQELFQVRLGPDGKPQKVELSAQQAPGPSRRLGRRIVERKKEEYEEYAMRIKDLAESYAHPDPARLQQLYQQGNITLASAGVPGEVKMVIHNYLKPGDAVTLVFDPSQKAFKALQVSSYLDNPQDAVTIDAQYSRLPDGTNHVSNLVINGVSKQLTVQVQNLDYQMIS